MNLTYPQLTPESFQSWAAQLTNDQQFNYFSSCDCVIANWIRFVLGLGDDYSVMCNKGEVNIKEERYVYPKWLYEIDLDLIDIADALEANWQAPLITSAQIKQIAKYINWTNNPQIIQESAPLSS
jgi:hypothetical protein